MIVMRSNIQTNSNPVAIGAPRTGEILQQIAQTPKDERGPTRNSSESEEKPLLRGGSMVDSELAARDVRWPKANWEIPADS